MMPSVETVQDLWWMAGLRPPCPGRSDPLLPQLAVQLLAHFASALAFPCATGVFGVG